MKNNTQKGDIIITVPKKIKWSDYKKELAAAEEGAVLNFKVSNFPKVKPGDRCYILYNGKIIGYHIISGIQEKDFKCTTTGRHWSGKFIQRTGKFHRITPIAMKGFQGFRYASNIINQSHD